MATGFEAALIKPLVDAFLAVFKRAKTSKLKAEAEKALSEAIHELLLAPANLRSAEAKIAVAKAQGIISADLLLAEEMVVRPQQYCGPFKQAPARRGSAKKAPAKKMAAKKMAAKKSPAKKSAAKKAPAKKSAF